MVPLFIRLMLNPCCLETNFNICSISFLFIADEMLGVPWPRALLVPEPELRERGPLPTRVGPLRVGVPGAVCGAALSSRPAHDSARDLRGPVLGPGGGAHLARLAHFQR